MMFRIMHTIQLAQSLVQAGHPFRALFILCFTAAVYGGWAAGTLYWLMDSSYWHALGSFIVPLYGAISLGIHFA